MYIFQVYCNECKEFTSVNQDKEKKIHCKKCNSLLGAIREFDGYVYVLWSELMPTLFKVGMTTRSVEERAKELSTSTGVPAEFKIVAYFKSKDALKCEQTVHKKLSEYRVEKKEFFSCSYSEIKQEILNTKLTFEVIEFENTITQITNHYSDKLLKINKENICSKCNLEMRSLKKGGFKCRKCGSIYR